MRKKNSSFKKSVMLFSLAALATYGIVWACADGFMEYDYDSSFTPEVYVDESYTPLFYSPQDVFYSIGFDDDYVKRFNDDIVMEWSAYLKDKITKEQLQYLLLNDSAVTAINQLYNAVWKKTPAPARFSKLNLADEKIKGFIEFMHYARIVEVSSTTPAYSWYYDDGKKIPAVDPKLIVQIEKLYTDTKDTFLKNRYWFQTMKAYFYSKNNQSIVAFFEKTKTSVPQNTLYYRGMAYVAGAHYKKKNYAASNYMYSVVFDKCPEMRVVTTYNFHPQEQSDFQASLAMAKTTDEKAALWSLFGYYADEKLAIQEIYKLNPASAHLDFLVTRLVNKEEVRLNAIAFTSAEEYRKTRKEKLDKNALQIVTTIAKEEKTTKPYLWNIAAGYMNTLAGNYSIATQLFDKAEKQGPKSELAFLQLHLMRVINTLSAVTKMDSQVENKLLLDLTWLYNIKKNDATFRYQNALNWSQQYIASLYKQQQNVVLAELFDRDKKFYNTNSNLEAMKAFLERPTKSPWEQLALGIYDITLSDIYEYQAVTTAYAGKLDNAIALMERSQNGKDIELLGNPFNGKIKDCHDCDHAATQKVKYTKLTFLKKMKEMQDHVDKGEDVYNNSSLLGNAYYNMTYFGNARVFYYGAIMDQYGNYIDKDYQSILLSCNLANQYYQKAFDAATTPEQKAKCMYMMTKCERNAFYTEKYHSSNDFYSDPEVSFLAWSGFKKLKADYSNTKYYKEVINECGYFRKYLGLE
ncbi:MAG TPA: hypothetical protein VIN08_02605 [Ohtaekwangia sp.]|uniref:hypothetical protein n=1 Tax=Ohtaekwangia sp. TaxID=2066019 RepID=UPI002F9447F3